VHINAKDSIFVLGGQAIVTSLYTSLDVCRDSYK